MDDDYSFKTLGATMDDAIGEAYDKVARVLNIPYPGGPGIERLAATGQNRSKSITIFAFLWYYINKEKYAKENRRCKIMNTYNLPRPVMDETYNFSYSGLKSSIINLVHNEKQRGNEIKQADLACSFQTVAIDELCRKLEIGLKNTGIKNVIVAGGVSANNYLREEIKKSCDKYEANLSIPKLLYCTDNAAMIGAAAYPLYLKGDFADYSLNAESQANIC